MSVAKFERNKFEVLLTSSIISSLYRHSTDDVKSIGKNEQKQRYNKQTPNTEFIEYFYKMYARKSDADLCLTFYQLQAQINVDK